MQLFIKVNVVFLITLVPCFLWYLYAIKVPWPKKLFYLSGWAGISSTVYRTETFVHESTIQPAEY